MNSSSKLAVVTGGSTGIGRCLALTLAERGWDVAFSYLEKNANVESLEKEIAAYGRRAWTASCDAGVRADVDRFYESLARELGRAPDLLVNNAGVQTWSSLLELDDAHWDRVIQTNLKGCFLNTQAAAKLMIRDKRRGAIVNIGSGCNKMPFPKLVDYTASKGGIEQLTKVAAIELGPHGITVNCVAPGAIENERTRQESPDYAGTWARVTPMRRVGRESDVAHAVLFFADEKSDFITGQTLYVDGGAFTMPNWPY
jgi:3-oxoacyl-[acyl-carrier protein] reductase